jgi:hypothetical protein
MASGWEFLPKNLTLRSPVRVFLACAEGIPPTTFYESSMFMRVPAITIAKRARKS